MAKQVSGKYWVTWADSHAKNSTSLEDLEPVFRKKVKEFIAALEEGGATVKVEATRRSDKRAYLFHWCWKIALGKVKPSEAKTMAGVDIEWDHGDAAKSKTGAQEMVSGFGLAVPPKSNLAPSLASNHIAGKAIDMEITWSGKKTFKDKQGKDVEILYMANPNANTKLHALGATYGVKKLKDDKPHWSYDGR